MQGTSLPGSRRIYSIDFLRGLVMIIMALDHVREYTHIHAIDDDPTNLATTTPWLFFTRWITHFCAPVFLFLSGTSAFLAAQKRTKKEQQIFLIKRGVWLILVEMLIITPGWTFNPFFNLIILQVIWAIGCSMIILGLLCRFSLPVIATIGIIILFGHNLLDYAQLPKTGAAATALNILFTSPRLMIPATKSTTIFDYYVILPWCSLMLLGYCFGYFFQSWYTIAQRKIVLLSTGFSITALFIGLRLLNHYGDPFPWGHQQSGIYTFMSFLRVSKYPISLQYACMTIGPALIVLALVEGVESRFTRFCISFGRVPFFYYVCHVYLVHLAGLILFFASGYDTDRIADPGSPFYFRPEKFGVELLPVYLIWVAVIGILYFPCVWFYRYKSKHTYWWLSYI